jgi:hypothetical protein
MPEQIVVLMKDIDNIEVKTKTVRNKEGGKELVTSIKFTTYDKAGKMALIQELWQKGVKANAVFIAETTQIQAVDTVTGETNGI